MTEQWHKAYNTFIRVIKSRALHAAGRLILLNEADQIRKSTEEVFSL